jgi:hypothetical protein
MQYELQNYMGRPKRYANIDGTGEISLGLAALGFALLGYFQSVLPADSMWRNGTAGLLFMYMILGPVLALGYWGGKAIKKHITWPRTGYVAYRRDGTAWWTAYAAPAVGGGVIAAGFVFLMRQPHMMSLTRMVYLTVFVGSYAVFVHRFGRDYPWKWLVLLFMALGLLAIGLAVPGEVEELSRPVMLFLGLVWLASGGATLYSYIRHTQPPAPESE